MLQSLTPLRYPLAALTLVVISACGRTPEATVAPAAAKVNVAKVIEQPVNEWDEVTARLESPETVQVRPRVSGQIDSVAFTDGELVKKGDLLFQIDPRPFEAEVHRLEAQLQQSKAAAQRSTNEAQRGERLRTNNAISAELADSRTTTAQESKAAVAAIQAQLDLARLNLSFTRVTAPITGRVSRAEITAGNIVTADQTILTSLVSTDKVYAYFDADERVFLKYNQLARDGKRGATTPVYMGLSNEAENPHLGQMNFVDNQVNPRTGTIRGRAVFDNSKGEYTPGLYARLKLVGSGTYSAMLIKDEAVGTDLGKKFVLVVDKDNKAIYRSVELGPKLEGLRIVRSGLGKDDRIVVTGLQRVRPGSPVDPQDTPMASAETLTALQQQRQALEASNTPKAQPKLDAKVAASATPRG
ncbi:efflux RND transporter periplasmic adaptor subunit [Pseudomonas sp. CFBP 13711]|jgi:multidrug efflux system membrane fusion protein|uniref:multidrug efflux RND transporter periplasmic adaptor subunit MexE n=1 Tax=unclassified Pseudomonas TaxID=196821 RepID=UPI0017824F65|nr:MULTISPECIES: efflux RND transporter periplasmic adaptor subunit [unclassified Pseudomonas]MBD8708675.1 efflux RND transporter periplasmic adaptor subunit [Pseudomonas sp. CFBP 13711]MBD8713827.1 efflux RND transporter periplasmic adaptor subunit [Pseudomonas sp. CFBP 13715]